MTDYTELLARAWQARAYWPDLNTAANLLIGDFETAILELQARLAKQQESEFHPDWSMLEATRASLREHQQLLVAEHEAHDATERRLEQCGREQLQLQAQLEAEIGAHKFTHERANDLATDLQAERMANAELLQIATIDHRAKHTYRERAEAAEFLCREHVEAGAANQRLWINKLAAEQAENEVLREQNFAMNKTIAELMPQPCCQEWDTCTQRCSVRAEHWRMTAKEAEQRLAKVEEDTIQRCEDLFSEPYEGYIRRRIRALAKRTAAAQSEAQQDAPERLTRNPVDSSAPAATPFNTDYKISVRPPAAPCYICGKPENEVGAVHCSRPHGTAAVPDYTG